MTQDDLANDSKRERDYRSNRELERGPVINVYANLRSLEESLEVALREMIDFRKKKEALKNEVNKLHDEVKAKNDTVLRVLCPALDNVKNDLTMNMNQQAEMNEEIQEEILDSKDEFQKVNDTIIDFRERVQCLEEDLGLYHG